MYVASILAQVIAQTVTVSLSLTLSAGACLNVPIILHFLVFHVSASLPRAVAVDWPATAHSFASSCLDIKALARGFICDLARPYAADVPGHLCKHFANVLARLAQFHLLPPQPPLHL